MCMRVCVCAFCGESTELRWVGGNVFLPHARTDVTKFMPFECECMYVRLLLKKIRCVCLCVVGSHSANAIRRVYLECFMHVWMMWSDDTSATASAIEAVFHEFGVFEVV